MDRRRFLQKMPGLLASGVFSFNFMLHAFADAAVWPEVARSPKIALIIDDIGHSLSRARNFLALNIPITFSILPKLKYSTDLSKEIYDRGHEIMLHQPMEPFNPYFDPGPGALYVGYETERIIGILEENIEEMPFASGVNNHMGSKFTSTQREIADALKVIRDVDLFFIDSMTSHHSHAYETARKLHMATAYRHIFLDNVVHERAIYCQMLKLIRRATRYGHAIGIGHPFPETAAAIKKCICGSPHPDFSFVYASQILSG